MFIPLNIKPHITPYMHGISSSGAHSVRVVNCRCVVSDEVDPYSRIVNIFLRVRLVLKIYSSQFRKIINSFLIVSARRTPVTRKRELVRLAVVVHGLVVVVVHGVER